MFNNHYVFNTFNEIMFTCGKNYSCSNNTLGYLQKEVNLPIIKPRYQVHQNDKHFRSQT